MEEPNIDALIVRHIDDLEAAMVRIEEEIDPKLNLAAWDALKRSLGEAYHFGDDDDPNQAWFAPSDWLDVAGDADPWFRLNAKDGSKRESWLACYAAPRTESEAISIQFCYQNLYVRDYKAVLAEKSARPF